MNWPRFTRSALEIELAIKEGKQVLRSGQITLRSKMPELVRQEFWGLAHSPLHCAQDDGASRRWKGASTLTSSAIRAVWKSSAAARLGQFWLFPPEQRANREKALVKEIGRQKASRSGGKSKERSIKAKPRPKFAPRRVGSKVRTRNALKEVEVLS